MIILDSIIGQKNRDGRESTRLGQALYNGPGTTAPPVGFAVNTGWPGPIAPCEIVSDPQGCRGARLGDPPAEATAPATVRSDYRRRVVKCICAARRSTLGLRATPTD